MSEAILEVNGLTKVFGTKKSQHKAVDNISFRLEQGECLGIIGKAGAENPQRRI